MPQTYRRARCKTCGYHDDADTHARCPMCSQPWPQNSEIVIVTVNDDGTQSSAIEVPPPAPTELAAGPVNLKAKAEDVDTGKGAAS